MNTVRMFHDGKEYKADLAPDVPWSGMCAILSSILLLVVGVRMESHVTAAASFVPFLGGVYYLNGMLWNVLHRRRSRDLLEGTVYPTV